jgi:hypothetical protein
LASEINLLFIPNYPSGLYQKRKMTCNLSGENRRFKSIIYKKSLSLLKRYAHKEKWNQNAGKDIFSDSNNWSVLFVN